MDIKETRNLYGLSQLEAAAIVNIPVRSFRRYECDEHYGSPLKREIIIDKINKHCEITEEKGLLTVDKIKELLLPILNKHKISYCYLFGSYAKGTPRENSDIDLLIDTDLTGFDFFGLIEEIRSTLHKKIDLLRLKDLTNDNPIVMEILKEGIRLL